MMNRCWRRRSGASVLLGLLLVSPSLAAEPTTEPLVRLETGMHTAMIRRIATDAAGRWAVTASDDKTPLCQDRCRAGFSQSGGER